MQIQRYTTYHQLAQGEHFAAFRRFLEQAPTDNYFQSPEFFEFIEKVPGYKPFLLLGLDERNGQIIGSLMGVVQSDGGGPKAWFSRRLIVWGGPIVTGVLSAQLDTAQKLLVELKKFGRGKAIFIEFRNFFDCTELRPAFEAAGFYYKGHLNYLVRTDEEEAVRNRMSSNRRRQVRTSLAAGASITEPETEAEVMELYDILQKLYREKVKKPLPSPELFLQMWKSPHAKVFLVKYEGKVVGGSVGPVYRNQVIYQWYVCGENGAVSGVHPSVLASWAPIEYGLKNGYHHFDFMGAGRPEEDYGVREFKARFGGEEVCFGRFETVLNPSLYRVGKMGLKLMQKAMR